MRPEPDLLERTVDESLREQAIAEGFSPMQARLIAGRLYGPTDSLTRDVLPRAGDLDGPEGLPDIEVATERFVQAIVGGETIAVASDYDVDGSSGATMMYLALTQYMGVDPARVVRVPSHRMKEGYGVSDAVTERILALDPRPQLVVTIDQGSTDEARIAKLKAAGIATIVTDHHGIPAEGPPASAVACVNPARTDSAFDPLISGCHVAWLVMASVRKALVRCGHLPETAPRLGSLIDLVGFSTSADCVSLARSRNNRAALRLGVQQMNRRQRPAWDAMQLTGGRENAPIITSDLGFFFGSRVNSASRIDDAAIAIDMMLADDFEAALNGAQRLEETNAERKRIEKGMQRSAFLIAALQHAAGMPALVVRLVDGHHGIHGISASRLTEAFGRPAVMFSPKHGDDGMLTGSFRSAHGVNIRQALSEVAKQHPGVLVRWGGHAGAAGAQLHEDNLELFTEAYQAAVARQVPSTQMGPVVMTDGVLPSRIDNRLLVEIDQLEPYGREFEPPVWQEVFTVVSCRPVGAGGLHYKLRLSRESGEQADGIWFNAVPDREGESPESTGADETAPPPLELVPGDRLLAAFTVAANTYRGVTRPDVQIKYAKRMG